MRTVGARAILFLMVVSSGCGDVSLDSLLLAPTPTYRYIPTDLSYPYDEMMLPTSSGGAVSAWHMHARGRSKGIVVIMPGADSNKGRLSILLPIFVDKGWDVLLYDYPGFGASPGPATLDGVLDGTRTALNYAFDQDDVVVGYGLSMGTCPLARLAVDYNFAACIFESTGNLREIGSDLVAYAKLPSPIGGAADLYVATNTPDDFDMKKWISQVKAPKLFLHSPDDSLTTWDRAWEIFKLAPQPKHMMALQGDHAEQIFVNPNMYRSLINGWMDGALILDPIEQPDYQALLDNELRVTLESFGLAP
jgi:uncharacterized protein